MSPTQQKCLVILDEAYQMYGPDLESSMGGQQIEKNDIVNIAFDNNEDGFQQLWGLLSDSKKYTVLESFRL